MGLQRSDIARPPRGQGRVLAVFSFRYDAHLVPDLLANIGPAVQGWVAWDDRDAGPALSDEPARRNALLAAAREAGADWILAADPDERFERDLAARMGEFARRGARPALWTFRLCEMFTPDAFRTDGLWGAKRQVRLFPAWAGRASEAALHGGQVAPDSGLARRDSGLRFYHLRMATPERRRHRRDTYAAADPGRRLQDIGYDYLCDEAGMMLRPVEPERGFDPPFHEDGGLWAPTRGALGDAPADPPATRLRYVAAARRRRGAGSAAAVVARLAIEEADPDLRALAAQLLLEAGRPLGAAILDGPPEEPDPGPFSRLLQARSALARGDGKRAGAELAVLRDALGNTPLIERFLAHHRRLERSAPLGNAWRRWAGPGATLREGARVAASDLAVVVIGFGAPPELRDAVASVLEQDAPAEVVVVNSGGGDVEGLLAPVSDRLRLVSCPTPLFVGAARNVGIEASRAPFVAFLAGDCLAAPGWVAGRLARHRAGAVAVATPVAPAKPGNLVALSTSLVAYNRRHADLPADQALRYGLSYARELFLDLGLFPPGLRVSEDTAFNLRLAERVDADWAPEVLTLHREPLRIGALLRDQFARGRRWFASPGPRPAADSPDFGAELRALARRRLDDGLRAARRFHSLRGGRWLLLGLLMRAGVAAHAQGVRQGARAARAAARLAGEAERVLAKEPAQAARLLAQAVAIRGQDWQLRLAQARAEAASPEPGARDRALRLCEEAAAIAPDAVGPLSLQCELLTPHHPRRALAAAEMAVARAPATAAFWLRAAQLALSAKRPEKAQFYAQGALALAPKDPRAHRVLARAHRARGLSCAAARREDWRARLSMTPPKG